MKVKVLLLLLLFLVPSGMLQVQEIPDCWCMPRYYPLNEEYFNEHFYYDTCSAKYISSDCDSAYWLNINRSFDGRDRIFAKKDWVLWFDVVAFPLPFYPPDTVIEVSWRDVDNINYPSIKNIFNQLTFDYRTYRLRKVNLEETTEKGSQYFNFQNKNLSNDFLKTPILSDIQYPLLKSISYYDAPMGNFILEEREEYYYDNLNRVFNIIGFIKKDITDNLIIDSKHEYTYIDSTNYVDEYFHFKKIDDLWVPVSNIKNSYTDSLCTDTLKIYYNDHWLNRSLKLKYYNTAGLLVKDLYKKWEVNYWQNYEIFDYQYNDLESILSIKRQIWDTLRVTWRNSSYEVYDFPNNVKINYLWNQDNQEWRKYQKETTIFNYDTIQTFYEKWNESTWELFHLEYEIYDTVMNRIIYYESFHYPSENNIYDESKKYVYRDDILNEIITSKWNGLYFENSSKVVYDYYLTDVVEYASMKSCIDVFPNPFCNNLSLKFTNLKGHCEYLIFDCSGHLTNYGGKFYINNLNYEFNINLNNLSNGIYFIQFIIDKKKYIKKIILNK